MRFLHFLPCIFTLAALSSAANPRGTEPAKTAPILPPQFAGWQMQGTAQTSTTPAAADPTSAPVLGEYRFTDFASANYTRDDGRTLRIRAARFADASGAFGAYTFYVQPEMSREEIGDQGASLGEHTLFYRGNVMIDATFERQSAMSAAELRELAGDLPLPNGNSANLPSFIEFMPRRGYIPHTQKYVMGPAALKALGSTVTADLVDFGSSAEVSLGRYNTSSGEATLTLISYPTPQLAAAHLKQIDAAHHIAEPQAGISTIENSGSFFDKRTGPIIAVVTGPVSDSDAKYLLGMVNWEANVTWNTPAGNQQARDLYQLLLNIVVLCAIIGGFAVVAGFAFGGFRILMKRIYPDKVFDRPQHMEFISLHLSEPAVTGNPTTSSAGERPASQKNL